MRELVCCTVSCYSVAAIRFGTAATVRRWILINDARFPFSLPLGPRQQ